MAQIDLKNAYVYLYDGSDLTNTTSMDSTPALSDVDVTPIIMASPGAPISLTFVDPGTLNQTLDVTVVGRDISVALATDAGSVITSTAILVAAAINAHAVAGTMVLAVEEDAGTGLVEAIAKTVLTTNGTDNYVRIKIGEGNLTYNAKRAVEFTLDRGTLDEVRTADQEPMDVTFDYTWENMKSADGATVPTVEEVLRKIGPAVDWVNSSSDVCRPSSVNVAVINKVTCAAAADEVIEIDEFYWEDKGNDLSGGAVAVTGRANVLDTRNVRVTTALIP